MLLRTQEFPSEALLPYMKTWRAVRRNLQSLLFHLPLSLNMQYIYHHTCPSMGAGWFFRDLIAQDVLWPLSCAFKCFKVQLLRSQSHCDANNIPTTQCSSSLPQSVPLAAFERFAQIAILFEGNTPWKQWTQWTSSYFQYLRHAYVTHM